MNTKQQILLMLVLVCAHTNIHAAGAAPGAKAPSGNEKTVQTRNLTTQQLLLAAAGTLAGTAWWAHNQHNHSKIGHDRYPFMNRRNILRGLIASEKDAAAKEELRHELAEVEGRLAAIQRRKDRFNAMRILGAIVAIGAAAGGIWGFQKKKTAD